MHLDTLSSTSCIILLPRHVDVDSAAFSPLSAASNAVGEAAQPLLGSTTCLAHVCNHTTTGCCR